MSAGNAEKAARLFMQASEVNPTSYESLSFLSQAYATMGRKESALEARAKSTELLDRHIRMNPDDARALIFGAIGLVEQGDRVRAIQWIERALEFSGEEPFMLYNVACAYALLGDTARALDFLERAVALGWSERVWIQHDSDLESLRDEPRFISLMQSLS